MTRPARTIHMFYCYARKDSNLREELEEHLEPLVHSGIAISWHDRKILAGEDWHHAIHKHLDQADFILLLVSPSFMRSDYCYGIELKRALERHDWGLASVIPIILRPTAWQQTPLGRLQALPRDGKPVVLWRSRDEAFAQIAQEIHTLILQREDRHKKEYWMRLGHTHFHTKHYPQALHAYRQASQIEPGNALLYHRIGAILVELGNYNEALTNFELSLHLTPNNATALQGKANMLLHLQRYEEALTCYQLMLDHFQATALLLCGKGHALFALGRYLEALAVYEQAIALFPKVANPYHYKGIVLMYLTRYEEALVACEQAIALNPHDASFYLNLVLIREQFFQANVGQSSIRMNDIFAHEISHGKSLYPGPDTALPMLELYRRNSKTADDFVIHDEMRRLIYEHCPPHMHTNMMQGSTTERKFVPPPLRPLSNLTVGMEPSGKHKAWNEFTVGSSKYDHEAVQTTKDLEQLPNIAGFPPSSTSPQTVSFEDKIIVLDTDGTLFIYHSNGELLWRYKPDRKETNESTLDVPD